MILEDEADPPAVRRNGRQVDAVEQHSPRVRPLESRHDAEQRALPRAAGPEHGHDLAVGDIERHAIERAVLVEPNGDVLDPKHQSQPARRTRMRSTRKTETAVTAMSTTASAYASAAFSSPGRPRKR